MRRTSAIFCLCSVLLCGFTPPLPPLPPTNHISAAIQQGAGAAALISKPKLVVPPTTHTNRLLLSWTTTNFIGRDQPFNGYIVDYISSDHKLDTNLFDVQTNYGKGWGVLLTTNHGPVAITTTNPQGMFRLRSYLQ